MVCQEGKVSLISFLVSVAVQQLGVSEYGEKLALLISESIFSSIYAVIGLYFLILCVILSLFHRGKNFQIAIRAGIIGYFFGISLWLVITAPEKHKAFGIYGLFLAFFHFSEYFFISISNPLSLSLDSFMLTHSVQYVLAAALSWAEFFIEVHFYPEMKKYKTCWIIGSSICILGEIIRKVAMLTAKKSFHHIVQFQQTDDHKLITNGIYAYMRHPSYVGWFYWSIATQIILANPVCFILYIFASWIFFKERIVFEEIALLNFFGEEYLNYQSNVGTGLPFISGYDINHTPKT